MLWYILSSSSTAHRTPILILKDRNAGSGWVSYLRSTLTSVHYPASPNFLFVNMSLGFLVVLASVFM